MTPTIQQSADGAVTLTFPASDRAFAALDAATRYLEDRGFSVGVHQADAPSGLLYGAIEIQKWRNLCPLERDVLHGRIEAPNRTGRTGPVYVTIDAKAPEEAREAILADMSPRSAQAAQDRVTAAAMLIALPACVLVIAFAAVMR